MKAINPIPHLFYIVFLLSAPFIKAQLKRADLKEISEKYYKLSSPKISDDGKWISVWKSYETNSDTLLVFNSSFPEKIAKMALNVEEPFFLKDDFLLLKRNESAQLLHLSENLNLNFRQVDNLTVFENCEDFIIHYTDVAKRKLVIYNNKGNQKYSCTDVLQYKLLKNTLYLIQATSKNSCRVISYNNGIQKTLLEISEMINNIEPDQNGKGILIQVKSPESAGLIYLDIENNALYNLKDLMKLEFENIFTEAVQDGESYYLKLIPFDRKQKNELVDIWYGKDNSLEEKFTPQTLEKNYLWKPKEKKIYPIGRQLDFENNISIENPRYFLTYQLYSLNDYTKYSPQSMCIYKFEPESYKTTIIGKINSEVYISNKGDYLIYKENKKTVLFHLKNNRRQILDQNDLGTPYFTEDNKLILFETKNGLLKYDIYKARWSLIDTKMTSVKILNGISKPIYRGAFRINTISTNSPILLELTKNDQTERSIILATKNGKTQTIVPFTKNKISEFTYDKSFTNFTYIEENYNLPFRLVHRNINQNSSILYQSNKASFKEPELRMDIINYVNSDGIPLKGLLYYPKQYKSSEKYPMVVHIYEIQSDKSNVYPMPIYSTPGHSGFSLRHLIEMGYFVYLPDIVIGNKGPGLSALNCIDKALDAIIDYPSINFGKIGLTGFSHGGYETNFIATHSSRFATFIAGAGNSDIVRSYHSYNYNFLTPFYFQYENGQYKMGKSFTQDKALYFENNPIYFVEQIKVPILIYTGKEDQNIYWEQTMEFYIALKRNNKDVIALFYPNEGHGMMGTEAGMDISSRIMDWWEYFLKDKKDKQWIYIEMKKDAD